MIFRCLYFFIFVVRSHRTFSNRQNMDDDRMATLEEQLQLTKTSAHESERKYEEVGTCSLLQ